MGPVVKVQYGAREYHSHLKEMARGVLRTQMFYRRWEWWGNAMEMESALTVYKIVTSFSHFKRQSEW